jgi:DNA transposition AAA+ family ATPase
MKPVFVPKISNVISWLAAIEALKNRGASESCMMLVDGEPGLGKTRTAQWWGTQSGAVQVRAKQGWTHSWCLQDLYEATSGKPATTRSTSVLFKLLCDALTERQVQAQRTGKTIAISIDEADHAVAGGKDVVEAIRDITDTLEIPTILVGMDRVAKRLNRYPQVASRIPASQRVHFNPLTLGDVRSVLSAVSDIEVKDDLIAFTHRACGGYTRELKEAIASIERFGLRQSGTPVGVEAMRGQTLLHDRATGAPIAVA